MDRNPIPIPRSTWLCLMLVSTSLSPAHKAAKTAFRDTDNVDIQHCTSMGKRCRPREQTVSRLQISRPEITSPRIISLQYHHIIRHDHPHSCCPSISHRSRLFFAGISSGRLPLLGNKARRDGCRQETNHLQFHLPRQFRNSGASSPMTLISSSRSALGLGAYHSVHPTEDR